MYKINSKIKMLVALLVVITTCCAFGGNNFRGEKHMYKGMPYRLLIPANYDSEKEYPLVFCLHGAGGRGRNNKGNILGNKAYKVLSQEKVQSQHPCFLLAPQCSRRQKWVNLPWDRGAYRMSEISMSKSFKKALDILDLTLKKFSIDYARIYVAGQSMGGYGAWYAAASRPELFAAAIPICGAGPPDRAKAMREISFWVFHGAKDTTVPVEGSRKMVEALRESGADVRYTEFPEVGHSSYRPAWNRKHDELISWLFAQQRNDHHSKRQEKKSKIESCKSNKR